MRKEYPSQREIEEAISRYHEREMSGPEPDHRSVDPSHAETELTPVLLRAIRREVERALG